MTDGAGGEPEPLQPPPHEVDQDLALARLEDVLQTLSYERALPDLQAILERAGVPDELLRRDDRVLKVLHEAVVARPFGRLDEVDHARTEVELLTLEVELLTDRLADPDTDRHTIGQAVSRLEEVRARMAELRDRL